MNKYSPHIWKYAEGMLACASEYVSHIITQVGSVFHLLMVMCGPVYLAVVFETTDITILTATVDSPANPDSLIPSAWTNRTYRAKLKDAVNVINFNPKVKARHVAVFTGTGKPLAFREIQIYSYSKCNAILF